MMNRPYQIAELAYDPHNSDCPWLVIRVGVMPEQGGPQFGTQSIHFQTLENALAYLQETTERDLDEIKRQISLKESEK